VNRRGLARCTAALVAIALMSPFLFGQAMATGTGNWPPPASGTWYINTETRVANETIVLNGDLIVNSTAIFENTTIVFASTSSTHYRLDVTEYGSLSMVNCTITAQNPSYAFYIRAYGALYLNHTVVRHAGYSYGSNGDRTGLWVNTNKTVIIENSVFDQVYFGIFAHQSHTLTLSNLTVQANTTVGTAIQVQYSSVAMSHLTVSGQHGIRMVGCVDTSVEHVVSSARIYALDIRESDNVSVQGQFDSELSYIRVLDSANITIADSTIGSTTSYGLYMSETEDVNVDNATLTAKLVGISLYNCSNTFLTDSTVNSTDSYGVQALARTSNLVVRNSEIHSHLQSIDYRNSTQLGVLDCQFFAQATTLSVTDSQIVFVNNTLLDGAIPLLVDASERLNLTNNVLTASDLGLQLTGSSKVSVNAMTIEGPRGIAVYDSRQIVLKNVEFSTTTVGTLLSNVTNAVLLDVEGETSGGTVFNMRNCSSIGIVGGQATGEVGILLTNCTTCSAESMTIAADQAAVSVTNSTTIGIVSSTISSNYSALYFENVDDSEIIGNVVSYSVTYGLRLRNSSNSTIHGNVIENCTLEGIFLEDSSNDNVIYENYLQHNNHNNSQVFDEGTNNQWDNGTLGNWYCNYNGSDLDHDGIGDEPYVVSPSNSVDHYPIVIDEDHDAVNDYTEELYFGTNPLLNDTDDDGVVDGIEVYVIGSDPLDNDTDGDGMPDGWEWQHDLNVTGSDGAADSDDDGLSNLNEYLAGTDPHDNDTDDDGMPDGWEVDHSLNPLSDDSADDGDEDGLTNLQEFNIGTSPENADSDSDGMPDGWEVDNGLNPLTNDASGDKDGDGLSNVREYSEGTNPSSADTDKDGMPDGWEVDNGLNPLANDANEDPDNDHLTNLYEYLNSTDPTNSDTDGDGLLDGNEIQAYGTDPLVSDTDGDTLSDGQEIALGTNPLLPDTDGDGTNDAADPLPTMNNMVVAGSGVGVVAIVVVAFVMYRRRSAG